MSASAASPALLSHTPVSSNYSNSVTAYGWRDLAYTGFYDNLMVAPRRCTQLLWCQCWIDNCCCCGCSRCACMAIDFSSGAWAGRWTQQALAVSSRAAAAVSWAPAASSRAAAVLSWVAAPRWRQLLLPDQLSDHVIVAPSSGMPT